MRWVAGFLLVGAAVLKAVELVTEPAVALVNPLGRYFLPVVIGLELVIGLLLLSGLYWHVLRWFALVLFTAFAAYSLYLAMKGAASCSCFGLVRINPWWSFGLDTAVVLGLLSSAIFERRQQESEVASIEGSLPATCASRRQAVALVTGIAVVITALLIRCADQRNVLADGQLTSAGGLVILEPDRWIGQKLPIAGSVELDLSKGSWLILLHRHDCPVCQEVILQFEQRAAAGDRVALVEVPPYGDFGPRETTCRYGRLKEDHEWFVQTPVEIRLQEGIVTSSKSHSE